MSSMSLAKDPHRAEHSWGFTMTGTVKRRLPCPIKSLEGEGPIRPYMAHGTYSLIAAFPSCSQVNVASEKRTALPVSKEMHLRAEKVQASFIPCDWIGHPKPTSLHHPQNLPCVLHLVLLSSCLHRSTSEMSYGPQHIVICLLLAGAR